MSNKSSEDNLLVIKRYKNRRLYNTETKEYVNYEDLSKIVRDGADIKVIDSRSKEDVTKSVLIQMILEEEKNDQSVLPTAFLFQVIRSRNSSMQDFFRDHLAASYDAYAKTKEQFDSQFRSVLEMAFSAPKTIENLIPGAEMVREALTGKKVNKEKGKRKK